MKTVLKEAATSCAPALPSRVLQLPDRGTLLVCTDLHGNLRDFRRMVELFEQAEQRGEQPFLLFSGDLIHGPDASEQEWPDYLGGYYRDESGELIEQLLQLQKRAPGRVACLIGNHEHSHVGGPHTPKFWDDETLHFELTVGPERTARYLAAFRNFPLVAISRCGIAVSHAAPNVVLESLEQLELSYEGYEQLDIKSMYDVPVIGRLLWSRSCSSEIARSFLDVLSSSGLRQEVIVFGHDIVRQGFERTGREQLQLSTSFGIPNENKLYLAADLAGRYRDTLELRVGHELRPLYD